MRKYSSRLFAFVIVAGIAATCEALEITGEYPIAVASGEQTISEVITGSGYILKTGAGTLKLTNAANDFSGGVKVAAGEVSFDAVGSQGTGKLEISGSGMIRFNAKGTFTNEIDVESGATATWKIYFDKQVTLTGAINASANMTFLNNSATTCTVDATVNAPDYFVRACGPSHWVLTLFKKKVVCKTVDQQVGWKNGLGAPKFCSTDNEFERIYMAYSDFFCGAAGCIPENAVIEWTGTDAETSRTVFNMYGFDQTVDRLHSNSFSSENGHWFGRDDTAAATLTMKATQSDSACCCLLNKVSLVYDAKDSSYVQQINNRKHTTTGTFTVKNGTLQFNGPTTAANATGIYVEGGTFDFNSTAANALVGLNAITVSDGATFKLGENALTPFPTDFKVVANFGSECTLDWPSGTVLNVKELWIDGVKQSGGYYTHAEKTFIPEGVTVHVAELIVTESGDVAIGDIAEGRDYIVMVAAGAVVTNTTVIGGAGRLVKAGGGDLVLTNANEYAGGTCVESGKLESSASGTFGTGEVRVRGGATANCAVVLEPLVQNATNVYPNAFVFEQKTSSSYPGIIFRFNKWTNRDQVFCVKFTGSVAAAGDLYTSMPANIDWNDLVHVVFDCPVDVSGYRLAMNSRCGVAWQKGVKAAEFYPTSDYPHTGYHFFYSPDNAIDRIYGHYQTIICEAANVISGSSISFTSQTETQRGSLRLYGHDQTAAYLIGTNATKKALNYHDYSAATLTLTGGVARAYCRAALGEAEAGKNVRLSVTVSDSGDGSFVQEFAGVNNVTYGTLKVTKGTMRFVAGTRIRMVPQIIVEGGTFDLATDQENAATNVSKVVVGSGATFKFGAAATTPFGGEDVKAVMRLDSGAVLEIPEGASVIVNKLYLGECYMPAGTYKTQASDGVMGLGNISGAGTLVVKNGGRGFVLLVK